VLCRAGGNHLEVQMLHSTVTSEETADMLQVFVLAVLLSVSVHT